ncbi:MAG: carboxypeptidase-like regulatory domain-containing protein, partial [Bacteroidales bacterium]|nr:carboxypeptidase-like regulatory domain-containing protein [Bacteroidales bacterium]
MPHSSYISKHLLFLLATLLLALTSFAQGKFAGRVTDAKTKEPLAFVNIIYNAKNQGTSTDLDGYFKIDDYSKIEFLRISYLGYTTKIVSKDELGAKHYIEIALDEDVTSLAEVTVLPGENPAHRIVNLVIANANRNNPEKMRSFSYVSYNKMYFTADVKPPEDTSAYGNDNDSSFSQLLARQHILLIESVTERIFRHPDNNKENVLAHRMSGMKNPAFTLLATQFQSMSFYSDYISLLDKRFLSPISKGSTSKYFFQIEDTMYNTAMDTVFVISFIPLKNKVFEGLKGVMNINTNGYAIESITAEPNEPSEVFNVSIQQKYELVDSIQWFPVQLNTNLIFNILQVPDGTKPAEGERQTYTPMVGIGKSYISDISLNPDIKRREFINQGVLVNDKATKQDDDFWNQYRKDSLTSKDLETYRVIDSLGK